MGDPVSELRRGVIGELRIECSFWENVGTLRSRTKDLSYGDRWEDTYFVRIGLIVVNTSENRRVGSFGRNARVLGKLDGRYVGCRLMEDYIFIKSGDGHAGKSRNRVARALITAN